MPKSNFYLTPDEVAQLTGVSRGAAGEALCIRQSAALKKMGGHYLDEIERVIVVRAVLEGHESGISTRAVGRGVDLSLVK